jgi:hypothetical protein
MFVRAGCAALVAFGLVGWPSGRNANAGDTPDPSLILPPIVGLETTRGDKDPPLNEGRPSRALLKMITDWLVSNFDLPATSHYPNVKLVSPMKMAALRHRQGIADKSPPRTAELNDGAPLDNGDGILALYDDSNQTILLPEGWRGSTPGELSVLVHEMVHHLQNVAHLKFECVEARERAAYEAQERWLELFGRNLADELEIDPFTVLVRSTCKY